MIANCSPADYNFDETLSTLRYASRAKFIKNKPIINEDPKDALLKEYANEIKQLKKMLSQFRIPVRDVLGFAIHQSTYHVSQSTQRKVDFLGFFETIT